MEGAPDVLENGHSVTYCSVASCGAGANLGRSSSTSASSEHETTPTFSMATESHREVEGRIVTVRSTCRCTPDSLSMSVIAQEHRYPWGVKDEGVWANRSPITADRPLRTQHMFSWSSFVGQAVRVVCSIPCNRCRLQDVQSSDGTNAVGPIRPGLHRMSARRCKL